VFERHVARRVPVRVVHGLEVVHVDDVDGDHAVVLDRQ